MSKEAEVDVPAIKDKLKPHCYICEHYFTFDELKDKRIEIKVELSNGTRGKIPICTSCQWDIERAEVHMMDMWKLEQQLNKNIKVEELTIVKKVA